MFLKSTPTLKAKKVNGRFHTQLFASSFFLFYEEMLAEFGKLFAFFFFTLNDLIEHFIGTIFTVFYAFVVYFSPGKLIHYKIGSPDYIYETLN